MKFAVLIVLMIAAGSTGMLQMLGYMHRPTLTIGLLFAASLSLIYCAVTELSKKKEYYDHK